MLSRPVVGTWSLASEQPSLCVLLRSFVCSCSWRHPASRSAVTVICPRLISPPSTVVASSIQTPSGPSQPVNRSLAAHSVWPLRISWALEVAWVWAVCPSSWVRATLSSTASAAPRLDQAVTLVAEFRVDHQEPGAGPLPWYPSYAWDQQPGLGHCPHLKFLRSIPPWLAVA